MVALESPVLIVDMISMVELGPKEEHEMNVDGIVDDCMTCHIYEDITKILTFGYLKHAFSSPW